MHDSRQTVLENGLRIVTERMDNCRSLSLCVLVEAGPADEAPGQHGLAHLTEHAVFQGTSNRSASEIAQLMDLAGGQVGGFTGRDYTCYQATVLDEHGTYALDLLGDMLLNSTFDPASLENEKTAILREIDAGRDSPDRRVHELLRRQVWGDHPLGRPIAGTPETVCALSREDVIYFLHENYLPDRLVIAAAGNLCHDDFVAQVRDAFWRMIGQGGEVPSRPAPEHGGGLAVEEMAVAGAYFSLALPAFPYDHDERYGLHLINNVLGGGMSSRLCRRLREERGLVYQIGSEYLAYRDAGLFVIEGCAAPENLVMVTRLICRELIQLVTGREPITEDELWKAKTQLRRQHLLSGELTSTRMSRLATQACYFGRQIPADEVVCRIEQVQADGLQGLTESWLSESLSRLTLAAVGPNDPDPAPALADLLADFS